MISSSWITPSALQLCDVYDDVRDYIFMVIVNPASDFKSTDPRTQNADVDVAVIHDDDVSRFVSEMDGKVVFRAFTMCRRIRQAPERILL